MDVPDKYNGVWIAAGLMGAGFLFPFNTYITAADFLQQRYKNYDPEFYISLVYMLGSCTFVFLNIIYLSNRVKLNHRLRIGYIAFLVSLSMFPIIEELVIHNTMSRAGGFWTLLLSVLTTSIGGGIQQSSLYGLMGIFGERYTMAMMVGESGAGLMVSMMRILTKASYGDSEDGVQHSTYLFLYLSISFIVCCFALSEWVNKSRFKTYRLQKHEDIKEANQRAMANVAEYLTAQDFDESCDESAALQDNTRRKDNKNDTAYLPSNPSPSTSRLSKYRLAKMIKLPMFSVFYSFVVTLSVFPGIATMAPSETLGDWMPVVSIAVFNFGDLFGKLLPFTAYHRLQPTGWTPTALAKFSIGRTIFIPLMMLSASTGNEEKTAPTLQGMGWPICLNLLLGVTGGYTSTLAMASGPTLVPSEHCEIGGIIMTMALLSGLTVGVLVSLVFLQMLENV